MGTYSNERNIYARCDSWSAPNEFVRSLANCLVENQNQCNSFWKKYFRAFLRSEEYLGFFIRRFTN